MNIYEQLKDRQPDLHYIIFDGDEVEMRMIGCQYTLSKREFEEDSATYKILGEIEKLLKGNNE